jgi:hypothetical protein
MSHAGAIGQFVAHFTLDGHAIAMQTGKLDSEQCIERNPGQEVANLASGKFGICHILTST